MMLSTLSVPMRSLLTVLMIGVLLALLGWRINRAVVEDAKARCFTDLERIPYRRVGLVLGTGKFMRDGSINRYYKYRLHAARQLFLARKVDFLLVSGDNGRIGYDEPSLMTDDLVAMGIPRGRIYQDYAGFRTWDSVVRANEVFGLTSITFVSQRFHNERALFLARAKGIDAVAYDAPTVTGIWQTRMDSREQVARVVAFLDGYVWYTKPRFLGPKVEIGS